LDAIQHSSLPQEASLDDSRMQEPDFEVSASVLDWLASSELRMEVPEALKVALLRPTTPKPLRRCVSMFVYSETAFPTRALTCSQKVQRPTASLPSRITVNRNL